MTSIALFILGLVFIPCAIWCGVVTVREKSMEALDQISKYFTVATIFGFMFLLIGFLLGRSPLWLHAATLTITVLAPISVSMWYALLIMTLIRHRKRLRMNVSGEIPQID